VSKRARLILVLVVLAAALGFALWGAGRDGDRMGRLTAQAPAEVTAVEVNRGGKGRDTTSIRYRYAVGGQPLEGRASKYGDWSGRAAAGSRGVVCYDPAKPEESEWFPVGQTCPADSSGGP
jgi:hypothetical protein